MKSLFFAPFYALAKNESDFENMLRVNDVSTSADISGISGGFGSFETSSGQKIRFVIGEYFMSEEGYVAYSSFDPLNSPLVLFIVSIIFAYAVKRSNRVFGEGAPEEIGKKGKLYSRISRAVIYLSYLFLPLYGLWLIVLWVVIGALAISILYLHYRELREENKEEESTQESTEDISS